MYTATESKNTQTGLVTLQQSHSALYVAHATSAEFNLHPDSMKRNTQNNA
jgi:hypothetical protein